MKSYIYFFDSNLLKKPGCVYFLITQKKGSWIFKQNWLAWQLTVSWSEENGSIFIINFIQLIALRINTPTLTLHFFCVCAANIWVKIIASKKKTCFRLACVHVLLSHNFSLFLFLFSRGRFNTVSFTSCCCWCCYGCCLL